MPYSEGIYGGEKVKDDYGNAADQALHVVVR
jgi:hypothetical protein